MRSLFLRKRVSESRDVRKLESGGWASAQSPASGVTVPSLPTCRTPYKGKSSSSSWCQFVREDLAMLVAIDDGVLIFTLEASLTLEKLGII